MSVPPEMMKPELAKHVVRVGVAVMVIHFVHTVEGGLSQYTPEILLGKRKGSTCAGQWNFPGGKPYAGVDGKPGETMTACAAREVLEETGMFVRRLERWTWFEEAETNYVTLVYIAKYFDPKEPKLIEPDKCEEWKWFPFDKLPSPIMSGAAKALEASEGEFYIPWDLKGPHDPPDCY